MLRDSHKWGPVAAWASILALICGQYILFRCFVAREVAWSYPPEYDQLTYLRQAYDTCERMLHFGTFEGLLEGAGIHNGPPLSPNGAQLHLQAALLMRVLSASRLTALTLNFAYFALFQIVLVYTLRWLSGRWDAALAGLGLLLTARTGFQPAGGIADFRLDFIAFSLFGMFICLVIRSEVFANRRWSLAAALAAALTMTVRFITAAYIVPIFAIMLAGLIVSAWMRREDVASRREFVLRCRNLLVAGACVALLAGPVLWHHRAVMLPYYLGAHVAEGEIRAQIDHVAALGQSLSYYPLAVIRHHAGGVFMIAGGALAAASMVARRVFVPQSVNESARTHALMWFFVVLCGLVPLVILTADRDKSDAVGGILVPCVLWMILLTMQRGLPAERVPSRLSRTLALVLLASGLAVQAFSYSQPTQMSRSRGDIERILRLYDTVTMAAQRDGIRNPTICNDSHVEFLPADAFNVMSYERHGKFLGAAELLCNTIMATTQYHAIDCLRACDFAILSHLNGPPKSSQYPFDRSMQECHQQLEDWCQRNMTLIAREHVLGRDVWVYERRGR